MAKSLTVGFENIEPFWGGPNIFKKTKVRECVDALRETGIGRGKDPQSRLIDNIYGLVAVEANFLLAQPVEEAKRSSLWSLN